MIAGLVQHWPPLASARAHNPAHKADGAFFIHAHGQAFALVFIVLQRRGIAEHVTRLFHDAVLFSAGNNHVLQACIIHIEREFHVPAQHEFSQIQLGRLTLQAFQTRHDSHRQCITLTAQSRAHVRTSTRALLNSGHELSFCFAQACLEHVQTYALLVVTHLVYLCGPCLSAGGSERESFGTGYGRKVSLYTQFFVAPPDENKKAP